MLLLQKAVNVFNIYTKVTHRDRLVTHYANKKDIIHGASQLDIIRGKVIAQVQTFFIRNLLMLEMSLSVSPW